MAEAAVCVVPLRVGGGTRLKIFEALAMGKAVVSTTVGAEGLPLVPGEHFVRADEPADFARAVVALLRDPDAPPARGRGAHLVEARYSWAMVDARLRDGSRRPRWRDRREASSQSRRDAVRERPGEDRMRVSVFGLGYVGCVTGACLARAGHEVVGVDVNRGQGRR